MGILVLILEISIKKQHLREVKRNSLRKPAEKTSLLPNCIEASDGRLPALFLCLLLYQVFSIAVGDCAGFTNQSLVLQLLACHFLVDGLQAQKESAMAKPAPERKSSVSPVTPLKQETLLSEEDHLLWQGSA